MNWKGCLAASPLGIEFREDLKQIRIVLPDKTKQEKITSGVQSSYSKMRTMRAQAAEVLKSTQKQVEQMILAK